MNEQPLKFAKRKATCIAVERSEMLALPKEFSSILYQKQKMVEASSPTSPKKRGSRKKTLKTPSNQDELNLKINFLQKLTVFDEVDAKDLMPIAVNMVPHKFKFGEFLIKEGEIPPGLFIIKSG